MAFSNTPLQPSPQRHSFTAPVSYTPYSTSYSPLPTSSLSFSPGPSIPSIHQPRSFTPPPHLSSTSTNPLQGRTSFSPSWLTQPSSLHVPSFHTPGSSSFQPPTLPLYPNISLTVPFRDVSSLSQPQFKGTEFPSFQLKPFIPVPSQPLSMTLPFRERWETSYIPSSPFQMHTPTTKTNPSFWRPFPSPSFTTPEAHLQLRHALNRHMEEAIRDMRSIDAHPEHLVPGWISMDRPHLIFQIDTQTTIFVDPLALNNFIQNATPQEQDTARTDLLQLATNSQAVRRIASNLTPTLGPNKALSSALKISGYFLSNLVHQCYGLYAREQANVSRFLNFTGLPSAQRSSQDLSQQFAVGHAKIDNFFNTNQAYRYDPEYKPFLQVASGEIPFLPSKGAATLVGRVQQLISIERRMAIASSVATGTIERRVMQESVFLHKRACNILEPFAKKPLPEFEVRELIHNTGFQTFPRPKGIPDNFLVMIAERDAGIVYVHPTNTQFQVRVMPGKLHSPHVSQRKPYVVQTTDKGALDKAGNHVSRRASEAHIPIEEFVYRSF